MTTTKTTTDPFKRRKLTISFEVSIPEATGIITDEQINLFLVEAEEKLNRDGRARFHLDPASYVKS